MTNEQAHEILQHIVMYGRYQFESGSFAPQAYALNEQKKTDAVKEFTKIKELLNKHVKHEVTHVK